MASASNLNAMQRLEKLRTLRLRGQAPVGSVMVTTQRERTELYEGLRLPTIEVWPGILPRLDWRGVAGLSVVAIVHWRQQDQRMELFDAIRAAEPAYLHWIHAPAPAGPGVQFAQLAGTVVVDHGEIYQPLFPELWRNYGRV